MPSYQSACRCASASPSANVVWCRSSARLNSSGTIDAAVCGVAQASSTSASRSAWCACCCAMRCVQPGERLAVRRQHQRVGRQQQQPVERVQVARQRIAVGLEVEHADVGRDARQHHVARDQQPVLLAVERHVLGRVAEADDRAEDALRVRRPDRDLVAVLHAPETRWKRRHQLRVVPRAARPHLRQRIRIGQAVAREVVRRRIPGGLVGAERQETPERVLGAPDRDLVAVLHAAEARRKRRHQLRVVPRAARAHLGERVADRPARCARSGSRPSRRWSGRRRATGSGRTRTRSPTSTAARSSAPCRRRRPATRPGRSDRDGSACTAGARAGGRRSAPSNSCSHACFVTSLLMPLSMTVQPARPSISSSSTQRLMWSRANGSGIRTQCTPGRKRHPRAERRHVGPRVVQFVLVGVHWESPRQLDVYGN